MPLLLAVGLLVALLDVVCSGGGGGDPTAVAAAKLAAAARAGRVPALLGDPSVAAAVARELLGAADGDEAEGEPEGVAPHPRRAQRLPARASVPAARSAPYRGGPEATAAAVNDGLALAAAFIRVNRTQRSAEAWERMRWNTSESPCGPASEWGPWLGPVCSGGTRITEVVLQFGTPGFDWLQDLGFELGPAIGSLAELQLLGLTGLSSMVGTIPEELSQLRKLRELYLYGNPQLSGTLPRLSSQLQHLEMLSTYDLPRVSGTIPSELFHLPALQALYLSNCPGLSGPIPEVSTVATLAPLEELYLGDSPAINGSIPAWLGSLASLTTLDLGGLTSLTGSIPPQLRGLVELEQLFMAGHSRLSGTIPEELHLLRSLKFLYLNNNPMLSGTIPASFSALSSLRRLDAFENPRLTGAAPDLSPCRSLRQLDLHNCSIESFPAALPQSTTHCYLNNNPIDAHTQNLSTLLATVPNLIVMDVSFINSQPQLGYRPSKESSLVSYGTRVWNPSPCDLGTVDCAFTLSIYDTFDRPLTVGGMVRDLELRKLGEPELIRPMIDNRDGTFTARIPPEWQSPGPVAFEFLHEGKPFFPIMDGPHHIAVAADCMNDVADGKIGGNCTGLRTVDFRLGHCPAHSTPADDGTKCVCNATAGFVPSGGVFGPKGPLSCQLRCNGLGENVSEDGSRCVCGGKHYDTSRYGVLSCTTGGWGNIAALASRAAEEALRRHARTPCATECPSPCTRCENGVPIVQLGWRLNFTSTNELSELLLHAGGRPQAVFSCPAFADCPEMRLDGGDTGQCPHHHTGPLCATCERHFSHRGVSDNACDECRAVNEYIVDKFGMPIGWFVVATIAILTVGCAAAYIWRPKLWWLKTNMRILLGAAQVLSLLPAVLELAFPPKSTAILSFAAVFVLDVRDIVRAECWGWSWYTRWLGVVIGIPAFALLPIGAYWLWGYWAAGRPGRAASSVVVNEERAKRNVARRRDVVRQQCVGALFFVATVLYPQLSSSILSAMRCRQLGPAAWWLEVDYSVSCSTGRFQTYTYLALMLVVLVPLGLPLGLLALLLYRRKAAGQQWQRASVTGDDNASPLLPVDVMASSKKEFTRETLDALGFCVEDYRADCFWFEPVDMLRKLALSGLLQFVHRGTAAQCFCGSAIAFASFGLQQYLRPYRSVQSNVLKAMVDTQLFLTFLISFILRVLPFLDSSEPFDKEAYGWLLVGSVLALVCSAVALTAEEVRNSPRSARVAQRSWPGLSFGGAPATRLRQRLRWRSDLNSEGHDSDHLDDAAGQSELAPAIIALGASRPGSAASDSGTSDEDEAGEATMQRVKQSGGSE